MPAATWSDLNRPGRARDFFQRRHMPGFQPAADGFHAANALWLSELSRLVYRHDPPEAAPDPAPTRQELLTQAGFHTRLFVADPRWHIHALLVTCEWPTPFAVLVFRGTEAGWRNYLIDADMGRAGFQRQPAVHRGFLRALDSVWPSLQAALLAQRHLPLFITGHSLGGALAVLAATRVPHRAVYTFGCPRVGNAAFAASLAQASIYRVVHGEDAITRIPPAWLGFAHVGQPHVLPGANDDFQPGIKGLWQRLTHPPRRLGHHTPLHYTDQLPGQ